jgi:hypothetical protein
MRGRAGAVGGDTAVAAAGIERTLSEARSLIRLRFHAPGDCARVRAGYPLFGALSLARTCGLASRGTRRRSARQRTTQLPAFYQGVPGRTADLKIEPEHDHSELNRPH